MATKTLQDGLYKELRELYSAEKQLTRALQKMAKRAANPELKQAIEAHQKETERQVERLEQAFAQLDKKPRGEKNEAMNGLIEAGEEILKSDLEPELKDAMLIAAAQKVEHFEIAAYGTARTWANTLGLEKLASLLEETLEEEKRTDEKLTQVAERINPEAVPAG